MGKKLLKKVVKKKLSTGHTIELVATDVKMLRSVYEYMAGFVKRGALMKLVGEKKAEVDRLGRMLGKSSDGAESPTTRDTDASDADEWDEEGKGEGKRRGGGKGGPEGSFGVDLRTEEELTQDRYYQCKEELRVVEDKVVSFNKHEHRISAADLDAILKLLGSPHSQKAIEYMMWECDEHGDLVIDWDEFLLTYWRNIQKDNTGLTEPNNFFNILEFISFDPAHRGFIMEDDVMEILFSRYGSARLEKELDFIFGNNLRVKGGDGTIDLQGYLAAVLGRTGRRAVMGTT